MSARVVPFAVLSLLYLWLPIAEVIVGARKGRASGRALWEGLLNLPLLPFLVMSSAFARPVLPWLPPWCGVLAFGLLFDAVAFILWLATCTIAARKVSSKGADGSVR